MSFYSYNTASSSLGFTRGDYRAGSIGPASVPALPGSEDDYTFSNKEVDISLDDAVFVSDLMAEFGSSFISLAPKKQLKQAGLSDEEIKRVAQVRSLSTSQDEVIQEEVLLEVLIDAVTA